MIEQVGGKVPKSEDDENNDKDNGFRVDDGNSDLATADSRKYYL